MSARLNSPEEHRLPEAWFGGSGGVTFGRVQSALAITAKGRELRMRI
jgi:hypothetical protein